MRRDPGGKLEAVIVVTAGRATVPIPLRCSGRKHKAGGPQQPAGLELSMEEQNEKPLGPLKACVQDTQLPQEIIIKVEGEDAESPDIPSQRQITMMMQMSVKPTAKNQDSEDFKF
ncbi:zinc finger protein 180 isoform X6 [Tupaia chinensis]|uniref:zinc finger protein 180 isoform X6 n=1 Tax=Tupaia chinensis TaxID=246437 RepID=UPI000FFCC139|nr:zinc finger protein 180 isoform X6 [Tupaia chinensis]